MPIRIEDREVAKSLGDSGGEALNLRARFLYGTAAEDINGDWDNTSGSTTGVSFDSGNSDPSIGQVRPGRAAIHLVKDDPSLNDADAISLLAALEKPTCVIDGTDALQINTDIGTELVGDTHIVAPDGAFEKRVKMVIVINDSSGALEIFAKEKTDGNFSAIPAGKTEVAELKEFSVPVSGTALTQEKNFIDDRRGV